MHSCCIAEFHTSNNKVLWSSWVVRQPLLNQEWLNRFSNTTYGVHFEHQVRFWILSSKFKLYSLSLHLSMLNLFFGQILYFEEAVDGERCWKIYRKADICILLSLIGLMKERWAVSHSLFFQTKTRSSRHKGYHRLPLWSDKIVKLGWK